MGVRLALMAAPSAVRETDPSSLNVARHPGFAAAIPRQSAAPEHRRRAETRIAPSHGPSQRRDRDRRPARGCLRGDLRPGAPPLLHRSLPHRVPPDPDRVAWDRRRGAIPPRLAAAEGLDGHRDRRAGAAAQAGRARTRRTRQPDSDGHGVGADRGHRLADQGPGLVLDRARRTRSTGRSRCSPPTPPPRSAAGARRCGGCAISSRAAKRAPAPVAVAGGNPHATGIP